MNNRGSYDSTMIKTICRKPEKPGQAARRMAAMRKRRKAAGWHRIELWGTDEEERSMRKHLDLLRDSSL